jgi:hypothetical protein
MTRTQVFPYIMIALNLCSGLVCAFSSEPKKAIYWFSASLITWSVA